MQKLDIRDLSRRDGETFPLSASVDLSEMEPLFTDVAVSGKIRNTAGVLTLCAIVTGTGVFPCDRCLEPVSLDLSADLDTVLDLSSSEDESVTVNDGAVDLAKTAYDALVLAVPMRILCREDCRGICPVCGKNRNDGDCGCNL